MGSFPLVFLALPEVERGSAEVPGPSHCPPLPTHPQVFDNTPAALDGTVAAGDEITGVNGRSIKGKTKVEVAKMIQEVKVRPLQEQLDPCGRSWTPEGEAGPLREQLEASSRV